MSEIAIDTAAPTLVSTGVAPTVEHGSEVQCLRRNAEVDWDQFVPQAYWEHNYRTLRNDDQSIIQAVGEFFSNHFRNSPQMHSLRALDVGSGANLYPALAMLPWSASVTLTDISAPNVAWLRTEAAGIGVVDQRGRWVWQPFWSEFARYPGYQQLSDPRAELAARHQVCRQGVLELAAQEWDLGTMFFVAESSTSHLEEFRASVRAFLAALVPGAPFAAAFMDSSVGYVVADRAYPAVRAVDVPLLRDLLGQLGADASVARTDVPANDPAQDGYEGMIVAVGTTATR